MKTTRVLKNRLDGATLGLGLALLLSACGGGRGDAAVVGEKSAASAPNALPTAAQTQSLLKKGAQLNTAELARAAEEAASGRTASESGAKVGIKAATGNNLVTVYRFYNSQTSAHFYTASESEKAMVLATLPQFSLDGPAFSANGTLVTGLSPVHRFYNTQTGVHFYTISEDEKTLVQTSLPQFHYDGVAYFASKSGSFAHTPLYRFYYASKDFHFYSSSASERDSVINNLPQYRDEGVGYYVIAPSGVQGSLKLPSSGVTAQQCYEAGSNTLLACASAGASVLNGQQDGHRTTVNPMVYSEVPRSAGGAYALTVCVKDNFTGLIWEGKEASGMRSGSNVYTFYDDPAWPQKGNDGNPTEAEIAAASNSEGYLDFVNNSALCGFTDWRLPSVNELLGIVDFGAVAPSPAINDAWFPNTPTVNGVWSSVSYLDYSDQAWGVGFGQSSVYGYRRSQGLALRLVRSGR